MYLLSASRRWALPLLSLSLLGAIAGCSRGSASLSSPDTARPAGSDLPPLMSLIHTDNDVLTTGQSPLGVFDFAYDAASNSASLTPLRAATAIGVGSNIATDVTAALSTATFGCPSCFAITSVDREVIDGQSVLTLGLRVRHPFQAPSIPTSRADLHINNVRLVFQSLGTQEFFGDAPNDPLVTGNVIRIRNADGYALLPTTFIPLPEGVTGNLFPFKVFETGDNQSNPFGNFQPTTGWSSVLSTPTGFNVLPMGGEATTDLQINLPGTQTQQISGRIALLANFVVSAGNRSQRPTPTYYMPEGAMLEAWSVEVTTPGPFLGGGEEVGTVSVAVADWQATASQDPLFPDTANPGGLLADSLPASVLVDIPGFNASGPFGPAGAPVSGTGTPVDPLVYELSITKPAGTPAGTYPVLVKVLDTRSNQDALNASLSVTTGLSMLEQIATYQTGTISVGVGDAPPTCGGYNLTPPPVSGTVSVAPFVNVVAAFDGTNDDNGIALVEMDWDYDGTFALSSDPAYRSTASLSNLSYQYDTLGLRTVAIRFTDTIGQTNNPVCTFLVNVTTASLPPYCGGFTINGNLPGPQTLTGGCPVTLAFDWTNDPDGNINYVEVDWDYDGTFASSGDPDYSQLFESSIVDSLTRVLLSTRTIALRWTDLTMESNDPATCQYVITVTGGVSGPAASLIPNSYLANAARIQPVDHRTPVASHGDNVYVLIRKSGTPFNSYIFRSADGGQTWGPGTEVGNAGVGTGTGGAGNYTTLALAVTASGKLLLFGAEFGGPFAYWINRLENSGVNEVAFDPAATNVLMFNAAGGTDTFPFATGFHADPSVQTDPTDASIAYVAATDGIAGNNSQRVRLVRVNNASSGTLSFSLLGDAFSSPGQSNFEPLIRVDGEGDVHCIVKNTNVLKYKEYKKGAGSIPADQTLSTIIGVPFNPYMAIGGDLLPVVTYDLSSDVYLLKASNATAPTFGASTPVLASSSVVSTQVRPFVDVDKTNNNIFVSYGDNRYGGTESSTLRLATTLSVWNSALTSTLVCDLQVDGPGTDDNNNNFGDSIVHITQDFSPSAKRYLVFWLDGDAAANTDPLYCRVYQ